MIAWKLCDMNKIKALSVVIIVAITLLLIAGCATPAEPLTAEPDFTGFITQVDEINNKDIIGTIAVESHADKILEKYVVTIDKDTALFRLSGDDYQEIEFSDLEAQQWLEIWFTGPVLESWPMQATALQVVITG
jgi:uncharacterized lipoprotein YajG